LFKDAARFVGEMAAQGKTVLFVGTKRQAQEAIADEAKRCEMYYVNQRWLGGLLTNYITVQKSIKRLKELEGMSTDGGYEARPKKEVIRLERERKHLDQNLAGIKDMPGLPDILFVIDSNKEGIAVMEARRLGIPVVAIVDTNCDPDQVDYVIPGNDDALRAIRLFASKIADSVVPEKIVTDEVSSVDEIPEYTHYVDPKYAEEIMAESLIVDEDLPSVSQKRSPAPEASEGPSEPASK
jgi:small subunit ribosomal protein S2